MNGDPDADRFVRAFCRWMLLPFTEKYPGRSAGPGEDEKTGMTLRWPSPPDLGAVPTVTELYAEIARLEFFIGHQAKFIEEQRVLLMDLRLQRDEAIKTAEVLAELRPLITVLRNLSV